MSDNIKTKNISDDVALTTSDNPYNPFTNWDKWLWYDEYKGYHTCSYLARIAKTSPEITDEDNRIAINDAIDEIIKYNVGPAVLKGTMYKRVYRD